MQLPSFDSELSELMRRHGETPKDTDLIHQLCYGFNLRGYHDHCIEMARRGLSLEPHHTGIYYELIFASSLDTEHTLDSIHKELQEILEQRPKDSGTLTNLALVHYFLEQDEVAESILSELAEEQHQNRNIFEILAQLEYARQNFEKAVEYADRAIDLPGPSARMVRMKGLCYLELDEIDQAQRSFIFCLELEPHFVQACHSLAALCMEDSDFVNALKFFGRATYINPSDPGNLFLIAEAFMDMDRNSLALAELEKLLMLKPNQRIEAEVYNAIGYLHLQMGNHNKAEECLKHAIELEPELALAYYNMAQVAQSKEDYAEAEACYKTALEHDPALVEAHIEKGFMQMQQEHNEAAQRSFENAIEVDPFEAQAYLGLSKLAHKNNNAAEQMDFALKASDLDPNHSEILNNLGIAYECKGDLEEAEEAYIRALEINDMNAAAANNLGYLYETKMKRFPDEAEHHKESAIEAWRERLRICLLQDRSTKAATTHLTELGLSNREIEEMSKEILQED